MSQSILEKGLSLEESKKRLKQYGENEIEQEKRTPWPIELFQTIVNPLVLLLIFIIIISLFTHDIRTVVVISIMVIISVGLKFIQENQAYNSAESLRSMVKTTCSVIREGQVREIDLKEVVPGDIVELSAGDIVPADLEIIESKELFINQSVLTGEALPVDKHATAGAIDKKTNPLEIKNRCFMGTNVESGHGYGIVLQTGSKTHFGHLAKTIVGKREVTSFDRGINKFTWLMIGFMAIMVPTVFLINGMTKGNWLEAFMFGIAIAVGLTPEMLPAIVTVNLSKGALAMVKKQVIVKHLSSIQNFGAMDVLCTDKTGTLTLNKIVLINYLNIEGKSDVNVLHLAYINSHFQTGFKNLLDTAVMDHGQEKEIEHIVQPYKKVDELPFDFLRKRLSVVVEDERGKKSIVCKGAVDEVIAVCQLDDQMVARIKAMVDKFSRDGFRVIAIARQEIKGDYDKEKTASYEKNLVFSGLMTFYDPPKETAIEAIDQLEKLKIEIKVLTGDNELVTRKIANDVGIFIKGTLLGPEIEKMSDEELEKKAKETTIFAKLLPDHKRRIVQVLRKSGNVVGFLGDGINDAPALRTADVGISVEGAVDIAKESADIILLKMSLRVLADGVIEGRKVFGNIIKYIKMGSSSNFGNMFSLIGASMFLKFLPMMPVQILVNNLLYDLSQTAIPLDNVDQEYIEKPRQWRIDDIGRFMLFIGPISSIFDYLTFFMMLYIFQAGNNQALFQTGWFVESLVTQTMIIHVIRSRKIPFLQTWASWPLVLSTFGVIITGILITFSPLASYFNFVRLPILYWPFLVGILFLYILLTQIVKSLYIKKWGYN